MIYRPLYRRISTYLLPDLFSFGHVRKTGVFHTFLVNTLGRKRIPENHPFEFQNKLRLFAVQSADEVKFPG